MHKSKCPLCGLSHTIKYGSHGGVQTYRCTLCGYRFRNSHLPTDEELWKLYAENKQTIRELSQKYKTSESTIKRKLRNISIVWYNPDLTGQSGYVHIDATYWGHNWGVMVAIDANNGHPLYVEFIKSETTEDYRATIHSIEDRGYEIKGLILDGKLSVFREFSHYKIQMCQYHMKQIIRRYITLNPRLKAARALRSLIDELTIIAEDGFLSAYARWKEDYCETIHKRSILKNGSKRYRHRRLRSAMLSIERYLGVLFTYQNCPGMPNTNNKIEGTFTDLKKNLNNHSGMSLMNRKRFISGFFLALAETLSIKKQEPQ